MACNEKRIVPGVYYSATAGRLYVRPEEVPHIVVASSAGEPDHDSRALFASAEAAYWAFVNAHPEELTNLDCVVISTHAFRQLPDYDAEGPPWHGRHDDEELDIEPAG